ncbi:hypothetical protein LSPH24S_04042 [Lysinibacillus sphaericus]
MSDEVTKALTKNPVMANGEKNYTSVHADHELS